MVRVLIFLACVVGGIHLYFYLTTGTFDPCKAAAVWAFKAGNRYAVWGRYANGASPLACYPAAIFGPIPGMLEPDADKKKR